MLTFGSLFAGIGGFDLGLERAGMTPLWQVEINDYCNKVLAKHWPDVRRYRDVRECGKHNLEAVDLICGGFPCQPVSDAGLKKAQDDPRWLWPEFFRIICEIRPNYAIMENVPGILGRGLSDVLRDLAAVGFNAEWQTIPASAFGAPHIRARVFIVAYPNGLRRNNSHEVFGKSIGEAIPQSTKAWWSSDTARGNGGAIRPVPNSRICGVVDGIPREMDRLRALGNAVVPQVVEHIGRLILEVDNA